MKVKINCKNCQKEMNLWPSVAKTKKFCSRKCEKENSKIKLNCEYCNEEFTSYKSSKRKYCSAKCSNKAIGQSKKDNRIKLTCNICNGKYKVIPHRVEKSKTCSRKCAQKYAARKQKTNRVELICLNCNKEYEVNNYLKNISKFCSRKCIDEYKKKSQIGEGNPNFGNYKYTEEQYNEWMKYRQAARSKSYRIYKKFKDIINPLNLKLGKRAYHLDHKYSIHDGFHNKVPVSLISGLKNLQILSYQENLRKGTKSEIEINELT